MSNRRKNDNLLNNQNYILGKSEKKKLLSKFFTEQNLKILNTIISKIYYFVSLTFSYITFIIISIFIIFGMFSPILLIINHYNNSKWDDNGGLVFLLGIFIFIFFIFKWILFEYIKNFKKSIKQNDFIRYKYITINNMINIKINKNKKSYFYYNLSVIFILSLLISYFIKKLFLENIFIIHPLIIFIFLIVFIFVSIIINIILEKTKINIYYIILFPFIFILKYFIIFFSFIFYYILKNINGYQIIKKKVNINFYSKLIRLEKDYAENMYYKLEIKK